MLGAEQPTGTRGPRPRAGEGRARRGSLQARWRGCSLASFWREATGVLTPPPDLCFYKIPPQVCEGWTCEDTGRQTGSNSHGPEREKVRNCQNKKMDPLYVEESIREAPWVYGMINWVDVALTRLLDRGFGEEMISAATNKKLLSGQYQMLVKSIHVDIKIQLTPGLWDTEEKRGHTQRWTDGGMFKMLIQKKHDFNQRIQNHIKELLIVYSISIYHWKTGGGVNSTFVPDNQIWHLSILPSLSKRQNKQCTHWHNPRTFQGGLSALSSLAANYTAL